MKQVKESQIAFAIALVGITSATVAHYAEFWGLSYVLSIIFAMISGLVFLDE